ncbi:hypothetical protein SAMD00019534_054450, partial [Acytostelium subglobosum LB1]|uniref:hypothetical protein n=1 Tax=Acytostelium subglobosum LB1 TaxID=1410327 RepID=UPI000644D4FA
QQTMSTDLHPTAKGYHNKETTDAYVKGRPNLPLETIDFIKNNLNLNANSLIVDLAAGTGKFTELLAGYGGFNNITAVEPSPEFRQACTDILEGLIKKGRSELKYSVVDGLATKIPLADQSVDAMFVSQAFHWFDSEASLREMTRVLKPGAPLVMVWCDMDVTNHLVRASADIFHEKYYDNKTPQFRSFKWEAAFENPAIANLLELPLKLQKYKFMHHYTRESLGNRVMSISYISLLSDAQKKHLLEEINQELDKFPETLNNQQFEYPYNVYLYYTTKK